MKKFAAIVLVLALSIMLTSAFATEKNLGMAVVTDLEGNILYVVNEDNTITDTEGNPAEYIPYITLHVDDETNTFEMSATGEAQAVTGTIEVVESDDTQVTLQLNPDIEAPAITAVLTVEDGANVITLVDEANGMLIMMTEIEAA